jgi:arylamine N-acetyltransferase
MNLQACLDVIEYEGTPQATVQDMHTIFEKFCKKIPFSTVHSDGVLKAYSGTDFYDRIITQQVGGVCMELAYVLDYILSQVGFTTSYVGYSPVPEAGMMVKVTINNEDWILNPSARATGLYKPIKLSQNYQVDSFKLEYNSSWDLMVYINGGWNKAFSIDPTERDFLYWQVSYEQRSQTPTDMTVVMDMISTVTESGTASYNNGTITTRTVDGVTTEQYTNQDLIDLFNYHGTV